MNVCIGKAMSFIHLSGEMTHFFDIDPSQNNERRSDTIIINKT